MRERARGDKSDTVMPKNARSKKPRPADGPPGPAPAPADARAADASPKPARRPARRTFLVAATMQGEGGDPDLRVFAAVKRTPEEAIAAVRGELGPAAAVELTGKLSNRMAKTLGLKLDEIRQI